MAHPFLDAVASGNDIRALEQALELWALTRDLHLAEWIGELDVRVREAVAGPKARSKADFQRAWERHAAEDQGATATGWLAASLMTKLPLHTDRYGMLRPNYMRERFAALFRRIDALSSRCPDPRIADAVIAVIERGEIGYWDLTSVEQVYRPLADLLIRAGDPRMVTALQSLVTTPRAQRAVVRQWSSAELPGVARQLEGVPVRALEPEVAEVVQRLTTRRSRKGAPQADALLAKVWSDPDDLEARAVLADTWIDQGHPQGAFVARQLQGHGDHDPVVRRMLREHRSSWVGTDLDTTLQITFRDGFPVEGVLRPNHVAAPAVWEAAARDERLATFRVLRQGAGNKRWYLQFLRSKAAPHLTYAEVPTRPFLKALAEREVVSLRDLSFGAPPNPEAMRLLKAAPTFACVQGWSLPPPRNLNRWLGQVARAGLAASLTTLRMVTSANPMWTNHPEPPVLPHWPAIVATLPELRLFAMESPWGLHVRFERESEGWALAVVGPGEGVAETAPLLSDGGQWLALADNAQPHPLALVRPEIGVTLMPKPDHIVRARIRVAEPIRQAIAERWGIPVDLA
ncbi:MAG: hypothetical protein AAGA48_14955 [Myxococcota bacterium]